MGTLAVETKPLLLFHCCTGKGDKTKLHQEYPHRKKRIPPLSRKLVFFANRNTQKNMQLLDEIHTVFTAALILILILSGEYRCPLFSGLCGRYLRWWSSLFEYRLYYARGRIIVIILGSYQALHPSTGLCYVEGLTPLTSVF